MGRKPFVTEVTKKTAAEPIRWGRIVMAGVVFTFALNLWVLHTELYAGASNIAGGNPPVPVLLALTILLLLRRWWRLTDAELLAFYLFAFADNLRWGSLFLSDADNTALLRFT